MIPLFGVVGLLFTAIRASWVVKQDAGNERMKEISTYVAEGAMAFLKAEWKILGYFVVIAAVLLALLGMSNPESDWKIALAFITGAVFQLLPVTLECALPPRRMCEPHRQQKPAFPKLWPFPFPVVPSWASV